MRIIIDGDPIVYAAGFSAQEQGWAVIAEDKKGKIREAQFKPDPKRIGEPRITALQKYKKWLAKNKLTLLSREETVLPDSLDHALHIVKQQLERIVSAVCGERRWPVSRTQVIVLLSGPGNFRKDLATIKEYKGNRKEEHKPYWYQQIRDYMSQQWDARVVSGHEADDEASILAWEYRALGDNQYVVVSVDKDLDQIPGHHYNYSKKVHYEVSSLEADAWFWQQVLAGDTTDNIGGCYMIGDVIAKDVVEGALYSPHYNPEAFWFDVVGLYDNSLSIEGCPYADKPAVAVATENARLVYMQRKQGELWNPPGVGHGALPEVAT